MVEGACMYKLKMKDIYNWQSLIAIIPVPIINHMNVYELYLLCIYLKPLIKIASCVFILLNNS